MIFTLPHVVAGTMVLAITAYVLLAGADFGGGVWDLLASGQRREEQRQVIANAIAPVWEANHVWLILVVVMLFSCFPAAFAHLSVELHIPLTLMLVGVVLRGSAFMFRSYDVHKDSVQHRWGLIFSIASVLTPVLLGICIGTVAAGNIPMNDLSVLTAFDVQQQIPTFASRFVQPWLKPFPVAVGGLTLALFAQLAATYLTVEAQHESLREDFRRRALASWIAVLLMAVIALLLAERDAPLVYKTLTEGVRAIVLLAATSLFAVAAVVTLWLRKFLLARVVVAAESVFIVWGWAWSQYPYLIPPNRTIESLAAQRPVLFWVMAVLVVGTMILLPSFLYLFRIFKSGDHASEEDAGAIATDGTH